MKHALLKLTTSAAILYSFVASVPSFAEEDNPKCGNKAMLKIIADEHKKPEADRKAPPEGLISLIDDEIMEHAFPDPKQVAADDPKREEKLTKREDRLAEFANVSSSLNSDEKIQGFLREILAKKDGDKIRIGNMDYKVKSTTKQGGRLRDWFVSINGERIIVRYNPYQSDCGTIYVE